MFRATRFIVLLAFSLLPLTCPVFAAGEIGSVSRVQNAAWALSTETNRGLEAGSPIFMGDVLSTGSQSRLEVTFADGTLLTLGQNAVIAVDDYVYDPENEEGAGVWNVIAGAFLMVTGEIAKTSPEFFSVRTPVAHIGIRGTQFWGGLIDDGYGVLVLEGAVSVTTEAGTVVLDAVGEGTMIAQPGAAPSDPIIWGDAKRVRAIETVTFAE